MPSQPWTEQANSHSWHARTRGWELAVESANHFARFGYEVFPNIPEDAAAELRAKVTALPFTAEGTLQHYDVSGLLAIPELKQVALSGPILQTAAMWLGCRPKILDVCAWRSLPTTTPELAQRWHRDRDDWRSAKLFVYLSDVGPDNGPHQYIAGSHREEFFRSHDLPPEAYFHGSGRGQNLDATLDQLPHVEFQGSAGRIFMTNNAAFHRGAPVRAGERVVFQVAFGLSVWPNMQERMQQIKEAWL